MSQQATSTANQQHVHYSSLLYGLFLIGVGSLVGYLWLWGNALSIMTSEAWIAGTQGTLTLSPQLSIFLQITQLWSGHLTLRETIAYAWGWLNQIIALILAIGLDFALISKKRAKAFKWICAGFVILNSLADLSFGQAFGGMWQPWAFAAICCFATFALGVMAIALIVEGFKHIIASF